MEHGTCICSFLSKDKSTAQWLVHQLRTTRPRDQADLSLVLASMHTSPWDKESSIEASEAPASQYQFLCPPLPHSQIRRSQGKETKESQHPLTANLLHKMNASFTR